jgi:hypothetical protein
MSEPEPSLIVDLLQDSMAKGKFPYLNVISNSMAPLIRAGDQIRLAPRSVDALLPGDVVVIRGISELVTHRYWGIVDIKNDLQLITKGDRPQHFDPPNDIDTLVGLVIARKRNGKLLELKNSYGQWLNRQLTRLAAVDNRLFAGRVQVSAEATIELHHKEGVFASSTRSNFVNRVTRRVIYAIAKVLTGVVQLFSSSTGEG